MIVVYGIFAMSVRVDFAPVVRQNARFALVRLCLILSALPVLLRVITVGHLLHPAALLLRFQENLWSIFVKPAWPQNKTKAIVLLISFVEE